MRKLKVYGGSLFYKGGQFRVVVAATSMKAVAEIVHQTFYYVSTWWTETGNDKEVINAKKKPNQIILSDCQMDKKAQAIPTSEAQEWFDQKRK